MRRVILESPFAGQGDTQEERTADAELKHRYLLAALADSLARGEAPFASHGLYPQVLDDGHPEQRAQGIAAGEAWRAVAVATVVYEDLGISPGMQQGIVRAQEVGMRVEFRSLKGW